MCARVVNVQFQPGKLDEANRIGKFLSIEPQLIIKEAFK